MLRHRPAHQVYAACRTCYIGWSCRSNFLDLLQGDFDIITVETSFDHACQFLSFSLADSEKTYSGLTDGCAAAGRTGCKLIEFTGDGASGQDVKNLINDVHDVLKFLPTFIHPANLFPPQVALELYRAGYNVPALPGFLTGTISDLHLPRGWSLTLQQTGLAAFCTHR